MVRPRLRSSRASQAGALHPLGSAAPAPDPKNSAADAHMPTTIPHPTWPPNPTRHRSMRQGPAPGRHERWRSRSGPGNPRPGPWSSGPPPAAPGWKARRPGPGAAPPPPGPQRPAPAAAPQARLQGAAVRRRCLSMPRHAQPQPPRHRGLGRPSPGRGPRNARSRAGRATPLPPAPTTLGERGRSSPHALSAHILRSKIVPQRGLAPRGCWCDSPRISGLPQFPCIHHMHVQRPPSHPLIAPSLPLPNQPTSPPTPPRFRPPEHGAHTCW